MTGGKLHQREYDFFYGIFDLLYLEPPPQYCIKQISLKDSQADQYFLNLNAEKRKI